MLHFRLTMPAGWRWFLLGIGLALGLLLAAAACGGDEEEEPSAETPAVRETPAAKETPTAQKTPEARTTPSGGAVDELKALSEEWAKKPAKVSYNFSSTSGGESDKSTFTLYWRPPDTWRMDFSGADEGDTSMIVAGDKTYLCTAEDGEGQCLSLESGPAEAAAIPFLGLFAQPEDLTETIEEITAGLDVDRSQRTIASEKGTCFSVSGNIQGEEGSAEWCFASDGLLLLFAGSSSGADGGEFRLEATKVDREVSDADFKPPYPVTQLPGLPGLTPSP